MSDVDLDAKRKKEKLVEELLKNHKLNRDLTGANVQIEVKKLRKKYNRVDEELRDFEQLAGLDWSGADLRNYNFEGVHIGIRGKQTMFIESDMQDINLNKASLNNVNLENTNLTNAQFQEAYLDSVIISSDCLLANFKRIFARNVNFNGSSLCMTNFEGAYIENSSFIGALLVDINFKNVAFLNVDFRYSLFRHFLIDGSNIEKVKLADVDIQEINNEKKLNKFINRIKKEEICEEDVKTIKGLIEIQVFQNNILESYEIAQENYRTIKNTLHKNGVYDLESYYHFKERKAYTKKLYFGTKTDKFFWYPLNQFFRYICGYGDRPLRIIPWILFVILFFGTIYLGFNGVQQDQSDILQPLDNYYFSVVTFTTLGFGDVYPNSTKGFLDVPWFRVVAALEAFIGAFLMALFVVVAAKRIMR